MNLDPQSTLQLAFKHLDGFSVPAIGTFRRKRIQAQIDHQKKRILPPQERFVLENGDEMQSGFEDFVFRWYNIKIDEAKALVGQIGTYLSDALQSNGLIRLDGVGTLRRDEAGELQFLVEDGIFSQATDFFGLQALDYTVGESVKPTVERKTEAAKVSVLANTTVVEPIRPRRRSGLGWILLLLVVLILGGAAWNWQIEVKGWLAQLGIIESATPVVNSDSLATEAKQREDSLNHALAVQDSLDAAAALRTEDSLKAIAANGSKKPVVKPAPKEMVKPTPKAVVKPAPKPVVKPTPKPVVKPSPKPIAKPSPTPKTTPSGPLNDLKYGSRPENGHFYLVISSNLEPEEAVKTSKSTVGSRVLVPYFQEGYYKVSVFESTNKGQVIAKMVSLKDKFPKSWIFWLGMPIHMD